MIRFIYILLLVVSNADANLATAGAQQEENPPVILVIGDSLSAAYGIEADKGWVSLIGQRLKEKSFNYQIVNASISGDTSANGLVRLPALLKRYQPVLVIVELGGNDGIRGLSIKVMKQNLSKIIVNSLQAQARVLLTGIKIPPNYGKRYTQAFYAVYTSLANEYQIPLVPFLLDSVGTRSELMQADGVHPTEQAQSLIAENVWPYLASMLSRSASESSTQ